MIITVLNQSKHVTNADAALMAAACDYQIKHHVAPAWAMNPVSVIFYENSRHLPPNARPIIIIDKPDLEDALGYHTEVLGKIWGRVFVDPVLNNGGVILAGEDPTAISVSSVMSHEVVEMYIDPYTNGWWTGPEIAQGSLYAVEACDPCEADNYAVTIARKKVTVSNFIYPHWGDPQATGYTLDFLNRLTKPFTMTKDGYMIVSRGPGTERQVFGEQYPVWRRTTKIGMSRTARRIGDTSTPIDDSPVSGPYISKDPPCP